MEAADSTAIAKSLRVKLPLDGAVDYSPEALAASTQTRIRARDAVYRRMLAVADAGSILLALWLAGSIVLGGTLEPAVLATIPLTILVAKMMGLYDHDATRLHKDTLEELPLLLFFATVGTLLLFFGQSLLVSEPLDQLAIGVLWASLFGFLLLGRTIARLLAGSLTPPERCLFVGPEGTALMLARKLDLQGARAEVVAVVEPHEGEAIEPAFGDLLASRITPLIERDEIDRVVLAAGPWDADQVLHTIGDLSGFGVKVSVLPPMSRLAALSFDIDELPGMALLAMRGFEITRSSMFLKRAFDVGLSALALAIFAPLFAVVALAIKLDSRGPVFFRQHRVGLGGKSFQMVKFRSMVVGADERKQDLTFVSDVPGLFKLEDDPRVTRVGRLLRKWSIDEMPQFINVLRGEMSMVGPRPLIPHEDAMVEGRYRRRLRMRPGITGHWQILGSLRVPLDEMVTLDYLYVANWSLWNDLKVMVRTVPYLAQRKNV